MGTMAYWISPRGKVIEVDTKHIDYIISNPAQFGLTTKDIETAYKKRKEPIGVEGLARADIMRDAIQKGWIRARYYDNQGWSLETYILNKKSKDVIWDFVKELYDEKKIGKHTTINVGETSRPGTFITSSGEDVLKGDLYESKEFKKETIKIFEQLKKMTSNIKLSTFAKEALITEIKLSRLYQYIEDPKYSFGIISPYRHEYSSEQNEFRLKELILDIKHFGYGYIQLEGGYVEGGIPVRERSLLVNSIKKDKLIELGQIYEQYSVLYKDASEFVEISTNEIDGVGKELNSFKTKAGKNNFTLSKDIIKKYYSKLLYGAHSNKKFAFSLTEQESQSFNMFAYGKRPLKWIKVI